MHVRRVDEGLAVSMNKLKAWFYQPVKEVLHQLLLLLAQVLQAAGMHSCREMKLVQAVESFNS